MTLAEINASTLWWNGPDFLHKEISEWPETQLVQKDLTDELRTKFATSYHQRLVESSSIEGIERLDPQRHSRWMRLVRLLAWVRRFVFNCRQGAATKQTGELLTTEIKDAEEKIILDAQISWITKEYKLIARKQNVTSKSPLSCLMPSIDEDGLLRANTRIRNAEYLPLAVRYPIILPRNRITKLIVKHQHESDNHHT